MERQILNPFESLRMLQRNLEGMAHQLHRLEEETMGTQMSVEQVRKFWNDTQYNRFANMYEGAMAQIRQVRCEMDECTTYFQMIVDKVMKHITY